MINNVNVFGLLQVTTHFRIQFVVYLLHSDFDWWKKNKKNNKKATKPTWTKADRCGLFNIFQSIWPIWEAFGTDNVVYTRNYSFDIIWWNGKRDAWNFSGMFRLLACIRVKMSNFDDFCQLNSCINKMLSAIVFYHVVAARCALIYRWSTAIWNCLLFRMTCRFLRHWICVHTVGVATPFTHGSILWDFRCMNVGCCSAASAASLFRVQSFTVSVSVCSVVSFHPNQHTHTRLYAQTQTHLNKHVQYIWPYMSMMWIEIHCI